MGEGILTLRLPDDLARAQERRELVVFAGAGPSIAAGLPDWKGWIRKQIECCSSLVMRPEQREVARRVLSHADPGHLKALAAFIRDRHDLLDEESTVPEYERMIKQSLLGELRDDELLLHKALLNLAPHSIVTTNVDKLFELCASRSGESWVSQIVTDDACCKGPPANSIVHLHGRIDRIDTLVVTTQQYRQTYTQSNKTRRFLRRLFGAYSVLFVGFAAGDEAILEELMAGRPARQQCRHALVPERSTEEDFFQLLGVRTEAYANTCGRHEGLSETLLRWATPEEYGLERNP